MYRLNFINNQEIIELKNKVRLALSQWMNTWSLLADVELEVKSISVKDFPDQQAEYFLASESRIPILLFDQNFYWEKLVFGNVKIDSSHISKIESLLKKAKKEFINSLFNQGNEVSDSPLTLPSVLDAYLSIRVSSSSARDLIFIAPHSYFVKTLEKKQVRKSEKLSGNRFSVIEKEKISIESKMIFSGISFSDLIDLKPGKILKSGKSVENEFTLFINGMAFSQAFIGKRSNVRAYLVRGRKNG